VKWLWITIGVVLAAALLLFFSLRSSDKGFLTLYGNVDVREVALSFRVGGQVTALEFEEGDRIEPGALMATLDPHPYEEEVARAQAALEGAAASLENSRTLLVRRQGLVGDGGVSQEDVDNARLSVEIDEARLREAKAELEIACDNLSYTDLAAPSCGILLTRIREPGTVVRAADPVYTLSLIDPVWVRAFIGEPDLGIVYPGMRAKVFTDTPGSKAYEGQVGFISPVAEFTPKTVETTQLRTDLVYRIRVIVDNPDRGLRQGMPVTVQLVR